MKLVSRRKALKNTISYLGLGLISPTLVSGVLSGCKIDNTNKWIPKAISKSNLNYIIEWIDIIIPDIAINTNRELSSSVSAILFHMIQPIKVANTAITE